MRNAQLFQKMNSLTKACLSGVGIATMLFLGSKTYARAQQSPNPVPSNQPMLDRVLRPTSSPLSPVSTPAPARQPVGVMQPINGRINIRLINQTYTNVVYQELGGETSSRTLAGRSEVVLQSLSTPTNLNFYRPDRGFLIVQLRTSASTPNMLELTMTETADQDLGRTSLIVRPNGNVYLY